MVGSESLGYNELGLRMQMHRKMGNRVEHLRWQGQCIRG